MSTSRAHDILRTKHAALFIAALIMYFAMESQAADVMPAKLDRYFGDYAGVVSKEPAHRFNQEVAQLERENPDQATRREHQRTGRTPDPNLDYNPNPKHNPSADPAPKPIPPSFWFFVISVIELIVIVIALTVIVIALIVISRILQRDRSPKKKRPGYPLRIAIKLKSGGGEPPQQLNGLALFPLFESLNSHSLRELVDQALENNPGYKPPNLLAWVQVETPPGGNAHELLKPLRKLGIVETAYVMRPVPPPVSATDDPLNPLQGYEDAAPDGIDARYAWDFTGGDGAGIGFVDLETGWNLNHQDLKAAKITIISGKNRGDHSHGTSVLGQLLMLDNTKGGVGIAPSAQGRVISQWRTHSSYNTADAIADAATKMSPGDVLLLEAQEFDPAGVEGDETPWPVEIADASYDAINLATAKGIVVVEAGANGGQDLDSYKNALGQKIFDRNSPDFRDSGAIMVGAGSSVPPHSRLSFSNYGNRIDCYAWGENIETTSTNLAGKINTIYRGDFKGTSGASPMVAGAALILQGIRQAAVDRGAFGKRFSPQELRDLLKANGTPSKTPATDKIGVMPDLRAIITHNSSKLSPVSIPLSAPS